MTLRRFAIGLFLCALHPLCATAQDKEKDELPKYIRDNYTKHEFRIPMRDGAKVCTVVYAPRDKSQQYPMLMMRTPYSVGPYGEKEYRRALGPNPHFVKSGYIFVYQDVRGCYQSEGKFEDMRPHLPKKNGTQDVDESTDTYDTVDWLLKNVPQHNGRVGQWGISYPGFYAAAGMINAHPALKAVSPQAPIADWWYDDFHHHGALFLPHAFNFLAAFGQARPELTAFSPNRFPHSSPDGYQFFLEIGSLKNVNDRYFRDRVGFWNRLVQHPNYDDFWKARDLLPHLKKVAPAVMTVGGWFDAEDLYGPLQIYRTVEKENPGVFNVLVMGPWAHGTWSSGDGSHLGNIHFGGRTSLFYQKQIELPFFEHFLKSKGDHRLPEAYVFETGVNRWRQFDRWPPQGVQKKQLHVHSQGRLVFEPTKDEEGQDEFLSDPSKPVPFTESITPHMTREYMTDDQRFAARRPDVLVYQTDVLDKDVTLAGPITAELFVSTSAGDADWIVKVIDVFPKDAKSLEGRPLERPLGGYQMMVRSEVIRGRFRNSREKPEPFTPNQPSKVTLELQDVLHTFPAGHRIMVQIQSTWFPLADRNPQKYVPNIYLADDKDFIRATHRVYRSRKHPTSLHVGVLPPDVE